MMSRNKWAAVILFAAFILGSAATSIMALDTAFSGNYIVPETQSGFYQEQYELRVGRQFQRGLENLLLGWLEIPHYIKREYYVRSEQQLPGGVETFFIGLFKGIWYGTGRRLVGAYEILTAVYPQDEPILQDMSEWLY